MPYYISDKQDDCSGWAMLKQNDDGSYESMGCHATKQEAIDHMIAAAVNTDGEAMGELNSRSEIRQVNLTPPAYMRAAARRGVKLHEEGLSGDGVRPQTVEDARKMAAGTVTEEKWRKIGPWIARHMVDLDAVQGDEITPGLVAHLLWGSGPTKEDARRAMEHANNVVAKLDEEREAMVMADDMETDERPELGVSDLRELPESYQEASDPSRSCGTCEYFDNERSWCERYMAGCQANMVCESWEADEDDEMEMNHWVVAHGEKRSVAYSNLELRAEGDGRTLVGYAAVFDSPSEPLPWTEFVRRGAFTKTIKDGADVRLLIDHEGVPLARTKSGTLRLAEDDTGLRIEASLDESNPDAAKLLSAMRRGDISQMSFAFETVKDAWSDDRRTRELKEVRLYDVSVVTYPAYEQTMVQLRNKQSADTDTATLKSPSLALRRAQLAIQRHKTSRSSAD
jgi:HK97 family phage prohead protease